ncbi:ubiquitin elongating factor core-domain-containing protein [Myxozyma melibiosi]|uniref:Ubiquitin elongating factor core-domain-containing protein n=1 Tax=Myxozyma melibiosi TaxID=54550 RepID=A0ABR1F0F8_9ASCO
MSDSPQNDAETIRRKRLAKLQGPQPERSPSQPSSATATPPPDNSPAPTASASAAAAASAAVARSALAAPPQAENPFGALSTASSIPKIKIARANEAPAPAVVPKPVKPPVDFKTWADDKLTDAFKFSLKAVKEGSTICYLEEVAIELKESGSEPLLSEATLDRSLLSRLSEIPIAQPFLYLLSSWRSLESVRRTIRSSDPDRAQKNSLLNEARRLCTGYAVLTVCMPEMFNSSDETDLAAFMVEKPDSSRAVPIEFIDAMILRATEDEQLAEFITPVITNLSIRMRTITMSDSYQPYFRALQALVMHKSVAALITEMPQFLPTDVTAVTIELYTILGPFLRISPVEAKVATFYFSDSKTKPASEINSAVTALRTELGAVQDQLSFIVDKIVRAGAEPREKMLQYFARAVNLNHKRRAIQIVAGTTSTDAFMLNLTAVLNKLCEPFIDATFSKIDRIDPLYFKKSDRIDIAEEVKLNADQNGYKAYMEDRIEGTPNFISEVFYLNVACHFYGLGGAMHSIGQLGNDIKDLEKHLNQLESEQPKWINSPQAPLLNSTLTRVRTQLNSALAFQHALNAVLQDRQAMSRSFSFLMVLATWLVRMVDPAHGHPQKHIKLPLADPSPDAFKILPEYFVEDITGFVIYFSRHFPQVLFDQTHVDLVTFAVTFVRSSSYIKNPYLKAKIIEVLYYGVQSQTGYKNGFLGDTLNTLPFANEHVFHMLMQFYIEIEQTGSSSQFYDKFNIRYYISQIVKCIWENPVYRDKLEQESKVDVDFFVRFVALLLNDVTYLLDESLSKLVEIHKLQGELGPGASTALSQQEQTERQRTLASAERQASSYMSLANETVSILKLFTKAVPQAFVTLEIVERLAAMLDYNLDALVGPKCTGLKVKDPQKYHFNPKALLSDIAEVYLNLSAEASFVLAVARDGRSYRREIFTRAASILGKYAVMSSKDIEKLRRFADGVEQTKLANEQGEEELGEIPDEFLDPLMYTLMEDPVILPSSRISIDRATIKSHLLSDATDPFNRMPLKLEDVIPNVELKAQIEEFRRSKRSQAQSAAASAAEEVAKDADGDVSMA